MAARRHRVPRAAKKLEDLKYEVARDLGLENDIKEKGWKEMPTRDVGRIGGNMVRKMIEKYEEEH